MLNIQCRSAVLIDIKQEAKHTREEYCYSEYTYDYDDEYTEKVNLEFDVGEIKIYSNNGYEFKLSEGYMMRYMLNNIEMFKQLNFHEIARKIVADMHEYHECITVDVDSLYEEVDEC